MSRASLMTMVYRAVDELIAAGEVVDVQRSDFARQVALRLLKARWSADLGSLPAPSAAPTDDQCLAITATLARPGFSVELRAAAGIIRTAVRALEEQLAARSPRTTTRVFSEAVAVWAGRAVGSGEAPDAAACIATAQDLVDEYVGRHQSLDADAFQASHSARWRTRWQAVGAPNLAGHRPSTLLLGTDAAPPLVRSTSSRRRDNWTQGTDRSVFSRYRLHFKRTSQHPPRACVDPACQNPARVEAGDPATAEVDRACEPWGLAHPTHHQVLRSIASGLAADPDTPKGRTRWAEWRTPCRSIDLAPNGDPEVITAVATAFEAWRSDGVGHDLTAQYGDLWGYQQIVETAVMRRAWMDLLGRERDYLTPARRCWLPSTIAAAFNRAAPDAVHRWFHGEDVFSAETTTRTQATVELLSQHPEVTLALLNRTSEARSAYLRLVDAAGPTRLAFLSPTEAVALLTDYRTRSRG